MCKTIDLSEDFDRTIDDHIKELENTKVIFPWSQFMKNAIWTWRIDKDILLGLPDTYHNRQVPSHLNQSTMEEVIRSLSIQISHYFSNVNRLRKEQHELPTPEGDSENCDSDDLGEYEPAIILKPTKIYDFLYFLSMYSTFDLGYKIQTIDDHYWETERSSVIQTILKKIWFPTSIYKR